MNEAVRGVNKENLVADTVLAQPDDYLPMNKLWPAWWAMAGTDLLSVMPPSADSDTIAKPLRGKVPSRKLPNGKWCGLTGKLAERFTTEAEAQQACRDGAGIGTQGRNFLGLDIDVAEAALADEIEKLAFEILGPAPVRLREGSARRLLLYANMGLRKTRDAFRHPSMKPEEKDWAVEFLGAGCYFNVEGVHPSGKPYFWTGTHPTVLGPFGLTEIDADKVAAFRAALKALVERHGCTSGKHSEGASRAAGADLPLDTGSHPAGPLPVLKFLELDPNELDYDAWVTMSHAIKAALGPTREEHFNAYLDWCLKCPTATEEQAQKTWDSIETSRVGYRFIPYPAEVDFDDMPADDGMQAANPAGDGQKIALDRMFASSVYIKGIKRFGDLGTGDLMDATDFCVEHRGVADYGLAGTKSADSVFINNKKRGHVVDAATYRPGKSTIVEEDLNGTVRGAFNTYRPPTLRPVTPVTDADVALGLKHLKTLLAPADLKHFLVWSAFIAQNPGEKINHGILLLGKEGIGKDAAVEPLRRIVGAHNTATIDADAIFETFNSHFLPRQLLILNEVHSFRTREKMNKLKPYLAAPPHALNVNKKGTPQYEVPNIVNTIMFSNHEDALAPTQDDRRYYVCKCQITEKPSKEYFNRFYAWLDGGGDAKFFGWLLARDISQFDHRAPPPMTAAKQAMIDAAQPAPLRWCREQVQEGGQFEDRKFMRANDLVGAAERSRAKDAGGVNKEWALAALKAEGFTYVPEIKDGKKKLRLWLREAEHAQMAPQLIRVRYREEAGLGGWNDEKEATA